MKSSAWLFALIMALSQSWALAVKSENRVSENQWLASFNFPVFGSLRQNPQTTPITRRARPSWGNSWITT
jgi:hypothetical protein